MVDNLYYIIFLFTIFACYGSFLNSFSYRLINNKNLWTSRSYCPKCYKTISFYDLIPIFSWIFLKAKCRACKNSISILYPFIEILSAIVFTALILFIDSRYWLSYFIVLTSLIIVIRTDFETMLISTITTLLPIPIAFISSYFGFIPISLYESIIGSLFGYFSLFLVAKIYTFITNQKKNIIGNGDFDLLALIGAFMGFNGVILSIFLGSILSTISFLIIILNDIKNIKNIREYKLPFGPWLSLGAILYLFFQNQIINFLYIN